MIRNLKYFLLIASFFVSLFGTLGSVYGQVLSEEMQTILKYQDERRLGNNNELLGFLESSDQTIVIAALNALANISDSTTIDAIAVQLNDNPSPEVREWAAFALGQIGTSASVDYLFNALGKEKEIKVLVSILNAIGKTGDENALNRLPQISLNNEEVQSALAMAVARFALRNIKDQNSIRILDALFASGDGEKLTRSLAYSLWRIRDRELLLPERDKIINLTKSPDAETRAFAINALNVIKEPRDVPFLIDLFNSENDWRVRVNILNTIGNYSLDSVKQYIEPVEELIDGTVADHSDHVKISAMQNSGKLFSSLEGIPSGDESEDAPGIRTPLRIIGSAGWNSDQVRTAAIDAYARILKDDAAKVLWEEYYYTSFTPEIIRAFGYFENGDVLRQIRDSISAYVVKYNEEFPNTTGEMVPTPFLGKIYRAYIETAIDLLPKMKAEESLNLARLSFLEFAGSRKPDIVYYSLQGLFTEQMKSRQDWLDENKQVLEFEYAAFQYPEDVDLMTLYVEAFGELGDTAMVEELKKNLDRDNIDLARATADALKKLTGVDYTVDPGKYSLHTDFDWDYLNSVKNAKVILKTINGDIEIELYPWAAPFTVMNFLKLAEKDYFDSTLFHRVIGNFVIQGGDPDGTGFGGPGYSIRSEFSPLTYEAGILGMASAGKDTEGSQFFITHSWQPHLDGKYTIFGKVLNGMDAVDWTFIGDEIYDVIVIKN